MLSDTRNKGISAALAYFKVAGLVSSVERLAVGESPQVFIQGPRAFRTGGPMHWSNVFWPKNYGTFGNWAGRLGTIAMLPSTVHATTEPNPTEGRLSSTLGTMGSLAGGLYGGTAGGLFGYPLGAIAGSSLGHGIGHILGSHPKDSY